MPTAALRPCAEPRCSELVPNGRCRQHARQVDKARSPSADRSHKHLYDSAKWDRLRWKLLEERVWCECPQCKAKHLKTLANVVHHKRPHGGDAQLFFDEDNLAVMLKSHHDRATAEAKNAQNS